MRVIVNLKNISMVVAGLFVFAGASLSQTVTAKKTEPKVVTTRDPNAIRLPAPTSTNDKPADAAVDDPMADQILPYYNNYLKEYRLGPNDMISVEVFGQCPEYCKTGITVPPNARISYPLIREGVLVAGKTPEQLAAEITQKLDEFIIDPKVTVTLDKALSARFSVMGNVGAPGVRIMDRKISVYEAILDSGGVTRNGDRNKIAIISYGKDNRLTKRMVSLAQMESGKAEMVYINPGDQVFVAGKGFSIDKVMDIIGKASAVRSCLEAHFD